MRAARTVAAALVMAGLCANSAHAADTVNLSLTRTATDIALYVADKRGYFKAEGLDVKFVTVQSAAAMIVPISNGDIDVMAGSPSAGLFNAVARGLDIRLVASKVTTPKGRTSQTLVVRKDLFESGAVKTIADLKGRKVANAAPGTASVVSLVKMLETAGLGVKDIDMVSLAFPQMVIALQNKAVDAALPAEPATTAAIKGGYAVALMGDDAAFPDHQIASIFFSSKFMREKPKAAQGFVRAFIKGARDHNDALDARGYFVGDKGDAIIAILTEYTPVKDPAFYKGFPLAYCDPDGAVNLASLKTDYAVFRSLGLILAETAPEKIVDTSLLDAVIKELGPYRKAP